MKKTALFLSCVIFFCSCASFKTAGYNKRDVIARAAKNMRGKTYRYGESSRRSGFDCSGLTQYAYKEAGVNIPRTAAAQYKRSRKITKKELKKADLVFFSTKGSGASHVGIYLGNGSFIHSPSSGKEVRISMLKNPYWKSHYYGAGRYLND